MRQEGLLVEHLDLELFRLGQLGACFFPGDDDVGLAADTGGHAASQALDELNGFVPRVTLQRSGQHHRLTCEVGLPLR